MVENVKVCFVILHYENIQVTLESIEYISKISGIERHNIVVVDNSSPNGSGKLLEEKYYMEDNIHIILNQSNRGFASGNNIGYKYSKEKLKANVIICLNSDVLIMDVDFIEKIIKYVKEYSDVSILAPDIVVKNGFHQNPYMLVPISDLNQRIMILKKHMGYFLYGIPYLGEKLINRRAVREYQPYLQEKEKNIVKNIIPHGACIIFTPKWTEHEEYAFVEGTFLFVEEELLFDYCKAKQHITMYLPDLIVHHMEDASQNVVNNSVLAKKRNQMKYEIESRRLLLKKRKRM